MLSQRHGERAASCVCASRQAGLFWSLDYFRCIPLLLGEPQLLEAGMVCQPLLQRFHQKHPLLLPKTRNYSCYVQTRSATQASAAPRIVPSKGYPEQ